MGETAEHIPPHEQAKQFYRGLLNPLSMPVRSGDFARNNFFNLTAAEARHFREGRPMDPFSHLTQNTPQTVLLSELVSVLPGAPDKQTLYAYAEAHFDSYYLKRAQWIADKKWSSEQAVIEAKVAPNAGIRAVFAGAAEYFDEKYATQFDVLLEETRSFAYFIAISEGVPEPGGEIFNLNLGRRQAEQAS